MIRLSGEMSDVLNSFWDMPRHFCDRSEPGQEIFDLSACDH
jgi:hypothetical protein